MCRRAPGGLSQVVTVRVGSPDLPMAFLRTASFSDAIDRAADQNLGNRLKQRVGGESRICVGVQTRKTQWTNPLSSNE